MLNINGHLIDHAQIVMVWPSGKILMRDHGVVNVCENTAKMLTVELGSKSREEPLTDNGGKDPETALPSSCPSRSRMTQSELSSSDLELHALCNRLVSLLFVGRSCVSCGCEIILENDIVVAPAEGSTNSK
jgi:hypothetical protein